MWIKRSTIVAIAITLLAVTTAPSNAVSPTHLQNADNPSADVTLTEQGAIEACHPKVPYAPPVTLHRNDDESSGRISLPIEMGPLNFLGRSVDELWVNNNGNITLDGPLRTYTPFTLLETNQAIIAPYFADVDTRPSNGGEVTYGVTEFEGEIAFCVTWNNVGYYSHHTDRTATFQLLLVSKSDDANSGSSASGNFDIVFNYGSIQWESGDASDGSDGFGGRVARLGYANGLDAEDSAFEHSSAGRTGALVDNGYSELRTARRNSNIPGRLIFEIRQGIEQRTGGGNGDDEIVYAALGDSYSSGVGTEWPRTDADTDPCYRSTYSYAVRLFRYAEELDRLINATCGGATTTDIITRGQFNQSHELATSPEVPQIAHLDESVDLVTLTIGGNDVGFSAIISYCGIVSLCNRKFVDAVGGGYDPNTRNIEGLYSRLFDTYRTILEMAPNASVFVLGYPNLMSNHAEKEWGCLAYLALETDEVAYFQRLNILLNKTIEDAAADAGVHYVDIASSEAGSQRHGVCSPLDEPDPLSNEVSTDLQFINNVSRNLEFKDNFFHPNRAGYEAYLNVLQRSSPVDLPVNPAPLFRRGQNPAPPHFFKIGFVYEYGGWLVDDTVVTDRPNDDQIVAGFDLQDAIICSAANGPLASCKFGLQISDTNGETWRATVYSDPIVVASGLVDSDGSFEFQVDDIVLLPGLHTLVIEIEGPDSTEILVEEFVVDSSDLPEATEGSYYTDAVRWAVKNNFIELSDGCFSPDAAVSRGETAILIWNMEGRPSAPMHSFLDVTDDGQHAAVSWMSHTNITTGTSPTTFSPDETLIRAHTATFLHRLAGTPSAPPHSFVDVFIDWQQDGVSWMSHTNITTGTSPTTFSPEKTLTRAHIVTFLYRYNGEPETTGINVPICTP